MIPRTDFIEIRIDQAEIKNLQRKLQVLGQSNLLSKAIRYALSDTATQGRARADKIMMRKAGTSRKKVRDMIAIRLLNLSGDTESPFGMKEITFHSRMPNLIRFNPRTIKGKKRKFPVKVKGQWRTITSNTYGLKVNVPGEGFKTFPQGFLLPLKTKKKNGYTAAAFNRYEGEKDIFPLTVAASDILGDSGRTELKEYIGKRLDINTRRQVNRFYSQVIKEKANGG